MKPVSPQSIPYFLEYVPVLPWVCVSAHSSPEKQGGLPAGKHCFYFKWTLGKLVQTKKIDDTMLFHSTVCLLRVLAFPRVSSLILWENGQNIEETVNSSYLKLLLDLPMILEDCRTGGEEFPLFLTGQFVDLSNLYFGTWKK